MLNNSLEHATMGGREREQKIAEAVRNALSLRPHCKRCRVRVATQVIGMSGDGEPMAVCKPCSAAAQLDLRISRQREERAAMRQRALTNQR
jgi:hypothetical protein